MCWRPVAGEHTVAVEGTTTEATGTPIEAVSKIAALTSVALILVVRFALYPGVTWPLRVLMVCALVGGWRLGRFQGMAALAVVAGLAPVLPVVMASVAGSADPVVLSVWLAALVGALLPSMCWTRWDLPAAWRVLLGGWALMLSLAFPILVARELGFDLRVWGDTATINSWAGMSAAEVSGWVMHVVLVQLAGLLWLDGLMRGLRTWSGRGLPPVVHGLWIGATVSSLVALYQDLVDLEFLSSAEWAVEGRATGLMLDANAYGMIAAVAAPLAAVAAGSLPTRAWWICASAFAINWGGVWMSGSRTALLCALAGTLALAISAVRRLQVRRAVWLSGAGALALGALAVAVTLSSTTSPLERTEEFAGRSPVQVAQTLLARGRYGEIAARMILEHPLTGVGVGTYHWLAPDYVRTTFNQELPFDNAQNWWRHQVAELGILGALPVLAWSILIAWLTIRGARRAHGPHVAAVRGLLLGLGLVSLVGMPTQDPAVLMAFFLLVAMLATASPDVGAPDRAFQTRGFLSRAWVIVGALAVAYASGHVALARGSLNVAERAAQTNRDYTVGLYRAEPDPEGGQFQWTRGDARLRLVKRGPWLVVRAWIQHPDATERPVALRIATPCQVVFERTLVDSAPVDFTLSLPNNDEPIDLAVRVSRTWSPASFGSPDTRELGAAFTTDFVDSPSEWSRPSAVAMEACGAAAGPRP